MYGVTQRLGISLSREESHLIAAHLDKDGDGRISIKEFSDKISLKDYQKKSHLYLISEKQFMDKILNEWYVYQGLERLKIREIIKSFDKNQDNIF